MTILAARPAKRSLVFHGVEEIGEDRWYLIDDLRLMSVTTGTGIVAKPALVPWAAFLSADAAFAELPTLLVASRIKPCERTRSKCRGEGGHRPEETCEFCPCGVCQACVTKWLADRSKVHTQRRSDEGKRVHDVVEYWALHGVIKPHDPDIAMYVKAFEAFVVEYGLTPDSFLVSEALVVHREAGYAGTTDGIIRFEAAKSEAAAKLISRLTGIDWKKAQKLKLTLDLIVDFKTRESEGPKFYPEQSLQVTGYRHAPVIRRKHSDDEAPMHPTKGGLLIQLRPDGCTPRLVKTDDRQFEVFLMALGLSKWLIEEGPASVSSRTFVLPATVAARAKKAAKDAAAAATAATPESTDATTPEAREGS